MRGRTEVVFFLSISVLAACAALLPAISQDQSYHAFADRRAWGFISNAADTLSNLAFVMAALVGAWLFASGQLLLPHPLMRLPMAMFLAGVALTGVASAFYHSEPSDSRLVVDRLAMSISFAGVLALLAADRVSLRASVWTLWGLLFLAPLTVLIWAYFGNLTPYAVLQFGGIFLVAALCLKPALHTPRLNFLGLLILYGLAKVTEVLDHEIFEFTFGLISGHSAKHVLAAIGVLVLMGGLGTRSVPAKR